MMRIQTTGARQIAVVVAVFALLAGSPVGATTFLDTSFGTPEGAATPRALGMGSAGAALHHGSDALFLNPAALLPPGEGRLQIDFSAGLTHASEDRLVPLFDSFQSFVDETMVALNRNTYALAEGGISWRLPTEFPMALGAGVFDRYDFDYDYFEEFRDPNSQSQPRDRILEERTIAVDGRLRSLSVGYTAELDERVRLGLSGHRYFGDLEREVRVVGFQPSDLTLDRITQSLTGWGFSVGGWARPNERIDLGVSFEAPFTVSGAFETTSSFESGSVDSTTSAAVADREIDYPAMLRFGLAYHPRNRLRTTFALELERRFWETLDEPTESVFGDTVAVQDTWDFRVGLEHVFYNELPVRLGFRYLESYADSESNRSIYSVGVGYLAAGFAIDVTGLYHRQTSRQPFLFDPSYLSFQAPGSDERVEDSVVQLVIGASRTF